MIEILFEHKSGWQVLTDGEHYSLGLRENRRVITPGWTDVELVLWSYNRRDRKGWVKAISEFVLGYFPELAGVTALESL